VWIVGDSAEAGVGSIAVSLANGKRPIVVPRLQRHREAVDDHQVALARRLHERGLVTMVEEPTALTHLRFDSEPPDTGEMSSALADDLSGYLKALVAERQGFSKRRGAATVRGERGGG
jgi:UDP-N-acetylglucosamine transferase subunit ALG13